MHFPLLQLEAKPSDAATAQKAARRCSYNICNWQGDGYHTWNHLEASCPMVFWGLKGVLSKQDNGHFGFNEHKLYPQTIPSRRSPERDLAIVLIISDLQWRLSKHLEDFLRFLGEAHGGNGGGGSFMKFHTGSLV